MLLKKKPRIYSLKISWPGWFIVTNHNNNNILVFSDAIIRHTLHVPHSSLLGCNPQNCRVFVVLNPWRKTQQKTHMLIPTKSHVDVNKSVLSKTRWFDQLSRTVESKSPILITYFGEEKNKNRPGLPSFNEYVLLYYVFYMGDWGDEKDIH